MIKKVQTGKGTNHWLKLITDKLNEVIDHLNQGEKQCQTGSSDKYAALKFSGDLSEEVRKRVLSNGCDEGRKPQMIRFRCVSCDEKYSQRVLVKDYGTFMCNGCGHQIDYDLINNAQAGE